MAGKRSRVRVPTVISNVPVPDPTQLTTEAVDRAILQLREVIETRLAGMDLATKLVAEAVDKLQVDIKEWIAHERELSDVKFAAIGQQFAERDIRSDRDATAAENALKAALQAAKELGLAQNEWVVQANAKTEANFGQQIKAIDDKIAIINQRLDRGESAGETRHAVVQEVQATKQWAVGQVAAVVLAGLALLGLIVNIAIQINR